MFTSLSIQNFRCFNALSIDSSFDHVNLIAGLNSVGKTALLEAIYLLIGMGNIELIQRLSLFRGAIGKFSGGPQQFSELFWEPLFHNLDSSVPIEIEGTHRDGKHAARLSVDRARSTQLSMHNGRPEGSGSGLESAPVFGNVLKLKHTMPDGSPLEAEMSFGAGVDSDIVINVTPVLREPAFGGFYFATHQARSLQEDAARYTRLESEGEPTELLETLKTIEPRLKRLRVGVMAGMPMLRGDVGIDGMVPFSFLGEGLGKLASIMLSIADAQGGVVLIDEIENGFHHSVLSRVWAAIGEAARRYDTQIFATTHSFECIEGAHEAFRENRPYGFRLHRLDRVENEAKVITYDQETLGAAIRSGLEVR